MHAAYWHQNLGTRDLAVHISGQKFVQKSMVELCCFCVSRPWEPLRNTMVLCPVRRFLVVRLRGRELSQSQRQGRQGYGSVGLHLCEIPTVDPWWLDVHLAWFPHGVLPWMTTGCHGWDYHSDSLQRCLPGLFDSRHRIDCHHPTIEALHWTLLHSGQKQTRVKTGIECCTAAYAGNDQHIGDSNRVCGIVPTWLEIRSLTIFFV